MSIDTRWNKDKTTLTIVMEEKFDYSLVQDFRGAYQNLPGSVRHISVDLSNTEYMDSSALGMLLNMQKSLGNNDIHYSIDNCRERVARILSISRFDKKFEINKQ